MKRKRASRRLFLGGTAAFLGNLFFGILHKATGSTPKSRARSPVTLPAGQPVATVTLSPRNETHVAADDCVIATLGASGGYSIASFR